ncbi:hypothetical protein [Undibacterium sp. Ji49W]|uniref:hypothetical protein n=1 Tax=Undibacterium sp. Ji49W TaxID=3413040 RepID=UPI003BF0AC00
MDGDALVLLDGKVHAMAKNCDGWQETIAIASFNAITAVEAQMAQEEESCLKK